jgi:TetR/AcrR family transcriptional regulator, transcriptional repressor for nem operon
MARILKENEYSARRSQILEAAQALIYSKGYEQMTIKDILDRLHISKGALYHYFPSKQALLEALIDRMGSTAEQALRVIVEDKSLSALEKFRRYFQASAQWKSGQKELILRLMSIWYSDENSFVRQKLALEGLRHAVPYFETMIRQGVEEKVFTTHYPAQAAEIMFRINLAMGDAVIALLLNPPPGEEFLQQFKTIQDAYVDSIERILGAQQGMLKVFEVEAFREWFGSEP